MSGYPSANLQAQCLESRGDNSGGSILFAGQLRMAMEIAPNLDERGGLRIRV
jgi:hypothetical protein